MLCLGVVFLVPVPALPDFLLLGRLEVVFLVLLPLGIELVVRLGVVFLLLVRLGIALFIDLVLVCPEVRLGIVLFIFIWLGAAFLAVESPKLFVLLREKFPP